MLAQTDPDSLISFSGYIFSEDSIPVEGAYIINYRTQTIVSTNDKGYFKTWLEKGDSLMINHISYGQRVVHANDLAAYKNKFYLSFEAYSISPVIVKTYEKDLQHFEQNMKVMFTQMKKQGMPVNYNPSRITHANGYSPGAQHYIAGGPNFVEIFKAIFQKKRNSSRMSSFEEMTSLNY